MTEHPRGDVTVTIDDTPYTLVPSFKAISAIQAATGKTLPQLVEPVLLHDVIVTSTILFNAIRANNQKDITYDEVGDAVVASILEDGQPLQLAAINFINAYFPKKKPEEKKPARGVKKAAG